MTTGGTSEHMQSLTALIRRDDKWPGRVRP